jgi:hypothetical protein
LVCGWVVWRVAFWFGCFWLVFCVVGCLFVGVFGCLVVGFERLLVKLMTLRVLFVDMFQL